MKFDLRGKTILITGASRGFGAELGREYWNRGANLILSARSESGLSAVVESLQASGSDDSQRLCSISADLSKPGEAERLASTALNAVSAIDVVVHNAAIQGPIGPFWETDGVEWEQTIQVNLLSPVSLTRSLLPPMLERASGKMIYLSGGGSTSPRPKFTAYGSAKTALVRFCETLAVELDGTGVEANCVAPGVMKTKMTAEVLEAGSSLAGDAEFSSAQKTSDGESLCHPRSLELCSFLASSESDGISGRLIAAIWDDWENLKPYEDELRGSDLFALRRILPSERGFSWGER